MEDYLRGVDDDVENTLRTFQAAIAYVVPIQITTRVLMRCGRPRKYRYMDGSLTQRRASLEDKIPDIKKTLEMVEFLRDRRKVPLPSPNTV